MTVRSLTKRRFAIENMERILARDPFYKPAHFFLAYAKLHDSEVQEASDMFAAITSPVHQEGERIRQSVREEWPRSGLRLSRLVRALRPMAKFLLPWMKLWQDITINLIGGLIYQQAVRWSKFDANLASWKDAKEKGDELGKNLFLIYILTFGEQSGIQNYVKMAAGLVSGDLSPEDAHRRLDAVLDEHAISDFDFELEMLEMDLTSLEFNKTMREMTEKLGLDFEIKVEDHIPVIRKLRETDVGRLFKLGLERLENYWQAEDWERCKGLLKELRNQTRSPAPKEAEALLLRALQLPKRTGWLIRFFLPAYTLLDRWRKPFQNAFFLESEYYNGLAKYRSFVRANLIEVQKHAFSLHDLHLAGPTPPDMDARRHAELRLLARCLEADAAVRVYLDDTPDPERQGQGLQAELRLRELDAELSSDLFKAAKDLDMDPNVRAAAYTSLGLLERFKRSELQIDKAVATIKMELGYYRQSLELRRDSDTCLAAAESLLEQDQPAEAQRFLKEALRLSPGHAGALALLETINFDNQNVDIEDP